MKFYNITSPQNEVFKAFKDLLTSKGIVAQKQAFVVGKKAVEEVLLNHREFALGVLLPLPESEGESESAPFESSGLTIYNLKSSLFKEIDVFGSHSPILLVKVPEFNEWDYKKKEQGCFLYLPFQDPSNVGAVLRSAAAFGVKGIILGRGAAHPFHPKSVRAASGSVFLNRYFRLKGEGESLSNGSIPLYGLDKGGEILDKVNFPESFILVPGAEGPGIDKNLSLNFRIGIPISAGVESLNAAIATSLVLYQWSIR